MGQVALFLLMTMVVSGVFCGLAERLSSEYGLFVLELLMAVFGTVSIFSAACLVTVGIAWMIDTFPV